MKNINDITYKIKFKKYFNLLPELNILTPNNNLFKIFNFASLGKCIFVGIYKNWNIFIPLEYSLILIYMLSNLNQKIFKNKIYYDKNLNCYYIVDFFIITTNLNEFKNLHTYKHENIINIFNNKTSLKNDLQNFNTYINIINDYEKYR